MPCATIVADFVEVGGGQHFQRGWRYVIACAIGLGQIIAITDLCDDLASSIVFAVLVNELHANELDWLAVVGFRHDCLTLGLQQRLHRPSSNYFFENSNRICAGRAKEVAATTLRVSATESRYWHRQCRIRIDEVAFNAARKSPYAEDVASLGQLVNMPVAPLGATHVSGNSGFESSGPIRRACVNIAPGSKTCLWLVRQFYEGHLPKFDQQQVGARQRRYPVCRGAEAAGTR